MISDVEEFEIKFQSVISQVCTGKDSAFDDQVGFALAAL